jgi:diguanylate cyclase (GGDEF)-like protein/PAS domain S-box-containing protein
VNVKITTIDRPPTLGVRAAAFDRVGASAAVLDGDGFIVDTNRAWQLFARLNDGRGDTTGIGVNYLDVCDRASAAGSAVSADVAAGLREILRGERSQMAAEYPCPSPTDDRWFMVQASALAEPECAGAVVFHVDITERKRLTDRLGVLADQDALTGLPNRRGVDRHLDEQLALARDLAGDLTGDVVGGLAGTVSTLFIDVDDFKAVNDTWGHHVGDELLVRVGMRIRRALRDDDFLGRLGGDEFLVICTGMAHADTLALADRLRALMSAPFQLGEVEVLGRISVGVAVSEVGSTVDSMMRAADEEMYVDKRRQATTAHTGDRRAALTTVSNVPTNRRPDLAGRPWSDRARAAAALTYSNDLVVFFAADGTIEWVSPACAHLFGLRVEDIVGLNGFDLVHADDRERAIAALTSIPSNGDRVMTDFRMVDADGRVRWVEEMATNLLGDPAVGCIVGNLRDVTERVELLERIELDRRRLADAHAAARFGSFEVDVRTGHISRSDELCRILGAPTGSSTNADGLDAVHPDDRPRVMKMLDEALAGRDDFEIGYRIIRPDGEVRWVHTQGVRLAEPNTDIIAGTMLDVTDRHSADEALAFQATHDWLTELPNPANLHASLQQALAVMRPDGQVFVAVIGIDHFGQVNDICGTSTGDEILRALAARLRAQTEPGDLVGRVRGDEFIVARQAAGDLDASDFGRTLEDILDEPLDLQIDHLAHPLLSFSVGVTISSDGDTPESMLADADAAMREAKHDGGDRVLVFDDDARARATRRRKIIVALPRALERNELRLEYQPIVDLASLRTVGFEALLRWDHPELGPITPDEFIPVAESNRLIVAIGTWVLDRALHQLAEWHLCPGVSVELWMAVNVSVQQLSQDFPSRVRESIERTGVPAEAVHIEITESVLMNRIDLALPTFAALQSLGVNISIDDFGTGYSSLSYLSRLPVDVIKIDGSFVDALTEDGDGASIIGAMITLARGLELDIVAEGVETVEQRDSLRALGCTNGQGFLWSRALRPDDARGWIGRRAFGDVATSTDRERAIL